MKELDDNLSGMSVFVCIVEEGSLSAAGRALGLPKATISRTLALLEKRMGTPLLTRSTRALNLTDTGRRFFDRVGPIVRQAQDAAADIKNDNAAPSGLLRVSASVAYGQAEVAPRLVAFLERYPDVRVDLHLSDDRVNLVKDGFDLAIRMGLVEDSEMICRKIADIPMVIIASPDWLKRHDAPEKPADLTRYTAVATKPNIVHWNVGSEVVRVSWRMSTGNMVVTRDAAKAGLGVALVPEFLVRQELAEGTLLRLLPDFAVPATQATALYAKSATKSTALRALMDFLLAPSS